MYLTVLKRARVRRSFEVVCRCRCGKIIHLPAWQIDSGHRKTCGSKECNSKYLGDIRRGKPRPDLIGRKPRNWVDRTGIRHRKLVFKKHLGGVSWLCECDCGNLTTVTTPNLNQTSGCRNCSHRKDIKGEREGMLVAVYPEAGVVKGRCPLWTFLCDCGNTVQGTVTEFHSRGLRSCGCHENAHSSWSCMLSRCYDKTNNRYNSYGGRGIKVCRAWHSFDNFIKDMGECPKRYNLGRNNAEMGYSKKNCSWEHISKNCRDTKNNGMPTKPGKKKGAKPRL